MSLIKKSILPSGAFLMLALAAIGPTLTRAQPSPPDGSVRFIAFGDWGRDGKHAQTLVAEQMGKYAAANHDQFMIVLGDNFYNHGVPDVWGSQWKTSFEDIYTASSLQVPWYVVLGNHDYRINPQAQVDYTLYSPRWKMPARYYTVTRRIDEHTTAEFFMLDTTPYDENTPEKAKGSKDTLNQDTAAQTAWLEAQLQKSTAHWKIVCGHHPVYSSNQRRGDTPEVIAQIEPLLKKYGVQLYLAGHDHDMQHLKVGAIHYFISGAASQRTKTYPDDRTIFGLGDVGGFLAVKLTPDLCEVTFIDEHGTVVYETTIPRVPETSKSE